MTGENLRSDYCIEVHVADATPTQIEQAVDEFATLLAFRGMGNHLDDEDGEMKSMLIVTSKRFPKPGRRLVRRLKRAYVMVLPNDEAREDVEAAIRGEC